jgi:hypothetical protein
MCTEPHCCIDVQEGTTVVLVFSDPEMCRIREAERRLREIGESAAAIQQFTIRETDMPFRPNPAVSFAAMLLSAVGMQGFSVPSLGVAKSPGPRSMGPYMNKRSAKQRNKSWAKNH